LPKIKTVTRTFSIREDIVEVLEKEARSRGISTSALVNQMIDRTIMMTWPSEKTGALVIAHDIVRGLLDALSADEIRKVGGGSAQAHKSTAIVLYGTEQKLESVLNLLDSNYGKNAQWYRFTHTVNGRDHMVLLNHELGQKWSIFLEAYMRSFFLETLDLPLKTSYTNNAVVLEFRI
jgi:hypothetical protein